jgi:hypothetical protein
MSTDITQFESRRSIEPPNGRVHLMSGNQRGEPAMSNPDSSTADQLRTSPRGYKVRSREATGVGNASRASFACWT